ncbi:bromodomain-containing protein [Fragilaria crotonensis]|nr:bromodomain-containing protein [Fragilaria crotonensis]
MTTPDEDFPDKWLVHGPHVGEVLHRFVWKECGLVLVEGTIVAQTGPKGRRPALYQWQSTQETDDDAFQILTQQELEQNVDPSVYSSHITSTIQQHLEHNLHSYTVDHVLPDCILYALLEEAWARYYERETQSLQSSSGTNSVPTRPSYYSSPHVAAPSSYPDNNNSSSQNAENMYFTVQSLHQRIKAGATLAYNYVYHHHQYYADESLRRSRRTTLSAPTRPQAYQRGGKIALYLLERLEGKTNVDLEDNSQRNEKPEKTSIKTEQQDDDALLVVDSKTTNGTEKQAPDHAVAVASRQEQVQNSNGIVNECETLEVSNVDSQEPAVGITVSNDHDRQELPTGATSDVGNGHDEPVADKGPEAKDAPDETRSKEEPLASDLKDPQESSKTQNYAEDDVSKVKGRKRRNKDEEFAANDDEEKVELINAHEEELESVEDDADRDEDFDTNDETEAEEEDDDILEGVVKEQPQLDIDMEGGPADDPNDADEDEEEDDDEHGDYVSDNPSLQPTPETLVEWMGRRGKSVGISEIQEAVGNCLKANLGLYDLAEADQLALGSLGGTYVLHSTEKWKDIKRYDSAAFQRCKFRLKSDKEEEQAWDRLQEIGDQHRKEKAWASWRFKGIHGGYTIWPLWTDSVKEWVKDKKGDASFDQTHAPRGDQGQSDEALAQAIALDNASSRRSARRGNTTEGVFYGTQSQMSQKQLVQTIVRICKHSLMHTLIGIRALVGDDSSNPVHRLRTALGRAIWKRNQIERCSVTSVWSDQPLWSALNRAPLLSPLDEENSDATTSACLNVLAEYIRQMHQTELQLRFMILRQLTFTPTSIIATAADERAGTLESFDATDFDDPGGIEWTDTGHPFIGKRIFRPNKQPAGENAECHWFEVRDFVESVAYDGPVDDKNEKGVSLAERRMRFRAFALENESDQLILTEAQVAAGIKAGEQSDKLDSKSGQSEHPFAGAMGTKVSLRSLSSTMECFVVGFDTIVTEEGGIPSDSHRHRALLLPQATARKDAFWAAISSDGDGNLSCRDIAGSDAVVYKLEQSDFDQNSRAFEACQSIISFLESQKHASIFMDPVDPVALNIPTYFDIIKRPMDITTLSHNLEKGVYSKIPPKKSAGRSSVSRMLNGPFGADALLIFDNAITFNPPDDWIHQTAKAIRKSLVKKIEQASLAADIGETGKRPTQKGSVYVDEDSDVDMYEYESDRDDEDFAAGRRAKKRKRKAGINKDDVSLKAIEAPVRLQTTLSETLGLRGPFASLSINSDAERFSLRSEWGCHHQSRKIEETQKAKAEQTLKELDEIMSLQRLAEESERASIRRSARAQVQEDPRTKGASSKPLSVSVIYHLLHDLPQVSQTTNAPAPRATSRGGIEGLLEQLHEAYYAKLYQQFSKLLNSASGNGMFANASFPPYLGRVVPATLDGVGTRWEIRSEYVVPALRWVIRGLVQSGHLAELEPLTTEAPLTSGVIMTNDVYYHDPASRPFDLLEIRRKKKGEGADESSEDEIELSEYEKLRAERVSRNAERLRSLGLA